MDAVKEMLIHFDRRRLKLLDGLNAIEGVSCLRSQGAFYLFPKISGLGMSSEEFLTNYWKKSCRSFQNMLLGQMAISG